MTDGAHLPLRGLRKGGKRTPSVRYGAAYNGEILLVRLTRNQKYPYQMVFLGNVGKMGLQRSDPTLGVLSYRDIIVENDFVIITVRNSSCGKVMFSQASVILSTGGYAWLGGVAGCVCVCGGHAWQGEHVWQRACMVGGMHGRGHAWQGGMCGGGGHVWQGCVHGSGVCMLGGVWWEGGACIAGGHA